MTSIRDTHPIKKGRKALERDGNRESHDLIMDNLRRVYGEVAAEPVPTALLDLLKKLDNRESGP